MDYEFEDFLFDVLSAVVVISLLSVFLMVPVGLFALARWVLS